MSEPMKRSGVVPVAPRVITPALVHEALHCIPASVERDTWVKLAMAIKSELGDAGFELWDAWSQLAESYRAADARDAWRGIKAGGPVAIGSLFHVAKGYGFRFPDDASSAPPTAAELERRQVEEAQRQRQREAEEAQFRERADRAARDAAELWRGAAELTDATCSPYLARKGVQAYGLRLLPGQVLAVPMRNEADELVNLQRIAPRPPSAEDEARGLVEKRYMPGGRKTSARHWLGNTDPSAQPDDPPLCLAEGYATAASAHEATGWPVAVCFDSGNLVAVAKSMPALHPGAAFLVLADDDGATAARTGKNPGREAAAQAVRALRKAGSKAWAVCPTGHAEGSNADFNDMHQSQGIEAVRACLQAGRQRLISEVIESRATGAEEATQSSKRSPAQSSADARTAAESSNDRDPFTLDARGVWFTARDNEGNAKRPVLVCAPIEVQARTRNEEGNGWGLLLQFADPDGRTKTWSMPSALLSGDSSEWAARLRDMGLRIEPGSASRNRLQQYLDTRNPSARVFSTDRVGWHGAAYVLPSRTLGEADDARYVFQGDGSIDDTFKSRGELADWQRDVAAFCASNSRLVFAICVSLAGPLLRPAGMESGGIHLVGDSSASKSTALGLAASVWGRPSFKQSWRSTGNALEATAAQHSDCTLILDELAQVDGREAGEVAYMLANEQEKGRAQRTGLLRKRRSWRLLFLSAGEITLAQHMADAGKRIRAGQEVRMVPVPMDAGKGMGGLEELHGFEAPALLADGLVAAAARCFGTAGRAWLGWLCEHHAELPARIAAWLERLQGEMLPGGAAAQVGRVCRRFAIVGAAGELASEAGVTGWQAGEAGAAARACFNAWLAARGHLGNGEEAAMLSQVRSVLQAQTMNLPWFHKAAEDRAPSSANRIGFRRLVNANGEPVKRDSAQEWVEQGVCSGDREVDHAFTDHVILTEGFRRELCQGYDETAVAKLLRDRGYLVHDKGRLTRKMRVPGLAVMNVYYVKAAVFGGDE